MRSIHRILPRGPGSEHRAGEAKGLGSKRWAGYLGISGRQGGGETALGLAAGRV